MDWCSKDLGIEELRAILEMLFSLVTPHSDNKSASQILANEELK